MGSRFNVTQGIVTFEIGNGACGSPFNYNSGSDQFFSGFGIGHLSGECTLLAVSIENTDAGQEKNNYNIFDDFINGIWFVNDRLLTYYR